MHLQHHTFFFFAIRCSYAYHTTSCPPWSEEGPGNDPRGWCWLPRPHSPSELRVGCHWIQQTLRVQANFFVTGGFLSGPCTAPRAPRTKISGASFARIQLLTCVFASCFFLPADLFLLTIGRFGATMRDDRAGGGSEEGREHSESCEEGRKITLRE